MTQNLEQLLVQLNGDLSGIRDQIKTTGEKAETEIKNLGKITNETKEIADKLLPEHTALAARVQEVEQKLARPAGAGAERPKSMGQRVAESEEWKAFAAANGTAGRVRIPVQNAITSVTTDTDGAAGDLVVPDRQAGILPLPQRRMTVRDLLMPGRTNSNAITYVRESGFTNNAAIQATEGATKAESTIKFDIETTPVITIAHFVKASTQILSDAPMLQSYVDGRLRYGLAYKEEQQLLNGSGVSGNLKGLYTAATAYSAPITIPGATMVDTIRLALLQAFIAEYPSSGIVLNPKDWAAIELTKTDDGSYLFANPQGVADRRLWGLPVVETQAMDQDKFLVGAFRMAAQIFDREDTDVLISTEDSDNFQKNLVTIRAEERLGMAIYVPAALVKGDFGNIS